MIRPIRTLMPEYSGTRVIFWHIEHSLPYTNDSYGSQVSVPAEIWLDKTSAAILDRPYYLGLILIYSLSLSHPNFYKAFVDQDFKF
jgi:hypothetical protein